MARRPEQTGPLIADRLRQLEHILEPVRGGTAIPGPQGRDGLRRGRAGVVTDISGTLMTA